jgi:diguanylate cyclase
MPAEVACKARRILVIDDNDAIHKDFRKTLERPEAPSAKLASAKAALFGESASAPAPSQQMPDFEIKSAMQGQEGLTKLEEAVREGKPFQVAFVDMRMPPGWDGVQTIQRLWQVDPNVQVVICTAYSDYSWEEISKTLGLTDRLLILKKPFDPAEIIQIATSLSEKWSLAGKAQLKMDQLEHMVAERTAELVHTALHDKLTGLPNRALLRDRIAHAIERRKRNPNYNFAVFFLDFDRFKLVNDSLGHEVGDELLVAISERLAKTMRGTDSVSAAEGSIAGRLGGDEFVILADDIRNPEDAGRIADRILETLCDSYTLKEHRVTSTVSIGITTSAIDYKSGDDMLRDADTAMYHAKAAGKARYVLFDRKMHEQVTARLEMENELRHAVERKELVLNYQPVVSLADGAVLGFEALVRWNHPTRGLVAPNVFIPCCEETGLIVPIGDWVLGEAFRQLKFLQDSDPSYANLVMSVNLSGKQLCRAELVPRIRQLLAETGVKPQCLILEITETVMIHNADSSIPALDALKVMGVRLHMDDFGTGYASLSCLHRFPLTGLKIDQNFVKSAGENRDYAAIVHAIVTLAKNLGMSLVAEGIETADQLALLLAMDCDEGQGYHFSKPLEASAVLEYLRGQKIAQPVPIRVAG